MKHLRFGDKIETSLNVFFFIFFQGSEFSRSAFGCHENSDPGKQIKKKDLSSSQYYYLNCFMVTRAIFIGGNSQKGSRYLSFPPGLSLSRPVDTKTDFHLNNIIATLSLIFISSVKQFAGKCADTYSNLISTPLDECPKLVSIDAQSYAALTSQSLRATIGPLQDN